MVPDSSFFPVLLSSLLCYPSMLRALLLLQSFLFYLASDLLLIHHIAPPQVNCKCLTSLVAELVIVALHSSVFPYLSGRTNFFGLCTLSLRWYMTHQQFLHFQRKVAKAIAYFRRSMSGLFLRFIYCV